MAGPALSPEEIRLKALKRFALSITVLNILGHTVLGFETSVLQVLVAVATTYSVELILQAIGDWSQGQRPAFMGNGFRGLVLFLLPAHITGFAISMLLFAHDELLPYVLAAAAAICSKAIFTVNVRGKPRHFLNPSNMGLVASILIYPKIGLAAPYEFTEHLYGLLYLVLPAFILYTGSLLNGKLTKRMPLIFAWVGAFILQAVVRHLLFGTWLSASLAPITGVPFVILHLLYGDGPGDLAKQHARPDRLRHVARCDLRASDDRPSAIHADRLVIDPLRFPRRHALRLRARFHAEIAGFPGRRPEPAAGDRGCCSGGGSPCWR